MGEVYLAEDSRLQRKVALKVLSREVAEDAERLRRLQREARSLAALDHPNIVPVYSFESAEGVHFLTMAFIEGRPLDELIPSQGFALAELLDLAVPIADALRAAHQQGIVHRDLKPANVMRDRDGRPRILDFGLAKRSELVAGDIAQRTTLELSARMTQEGTILGTFPYMSPEQAEGKPLDARSDIFSFGVMLYEMACGRRPFSGDTAVSLLSSILRDQPRPVWELRPGLPAELDRILVRCLEKDPAGRYAAAEELRSDLEALRAEVARGEVRVAAPVGPTVVVAAATPRDRSRAPTRRRALGLAALALGAMALGVAAWRLWPRPAAVRSLAVLPFTNSADDPDIEYLCDGLTEGLIRRFSGLPNLRVSPLSAVIHLKGQHVSPREAGRLLAAGSVLTGELERQGERLQVAASLVDGASGEQLWSGSYDRAESELLALQEEMATVVADQGLRAELTREERSRLLRNPTANGDAYDLYLQARHLQRLGTEDAYLEAAELLERATIRDPRFAQAYLTLAGIHTAMVIDGYVRPTDGWARANRFLRQAVALEPDLPDAPAIQHGLAFFFDWDWRGAELERQRFLRSSAGEFTPDMLRTYSFELLALGRLDEALTLARRARELDPLSSVLAMLEADYLVRAGHLDAAIALYRRAIEVEPENPAPYFGLAEALLQHGRFDEAIDARRRAHAAAGDEAMARLFAAARGEQGYRQADREWIRMQLVALEARSTWAYVSPLDFARAYAQLGDGERAFEYLEKAFADRCPGLVLLNMDRAWDTVRGDPRFEEAVRRVGLPTPARLTEG